MVAKKLRNLKRKLEEGDFSVLRKIRETVLELRAPEQLVGSFSAATFFFGSIVMVLFVMPNCRLLSG